MTAPRCTDQQIRDLAAAGVPVNEIRRILHVGHTRIKRAAPDAGRKLVPPERIKMLLDEGYAHKHVANMLRVSPARIRMLFPGTQWTNSQAAVYGNDVIRLEKI